MSVRFIALVVGCLLLCAGVISYKVLALGYRLDPSSGDRWSIQVTLRGDPQDQRARVSLALPRDAANQIYDEHFSSPGLKLAIKTRGHTRVATFTGETEHPHDPFAVVYRFGAQHQSESKSLARPTADDTAPSGFIPADDLDVRAKATEVAATTTDEGARIRGLYDFIVDEVAADPVVPDTAPETTLQALVHHRGGARARTRLFVALCRALRIPARLVYAVALIEGTNRPIIVRAEAFADGRWVQVDPVRARYGADANEGIILGTTDDDFVRAEGTSGLDVDVTVARESVNQYEQFQRRIHRGEKLFDWFSLYALPPQSQLVFRVLLLVPLGALVVSLFRNLVGVPTFGTFIPILIALALRETRPLAGLVMLAIVVTIGLVGRTLLERLRLLIVPRLSLLLTLVIFVMGVVALVAARFDANAGLSIALLPMVIMTMTIERLSVIMAEEGPRPALRTLGGTLLVAGVGYALIQSDTLQGAVFTFPELNLIVVAMLLLLGRYTGYRLSERLRFRALRARREPRS